MSDPNVQNIDDGQPFELPDRDPPPSIGGGSGGGGMEARVARIESDVEHIKVTLRDFRDDLKMLDTRQRTGFQNLESRLRDEIKGLSDRRKEDVARLVKAAWVVGGTIVVALVGIYKFLYDLGLSIANMN